MKSPIFQIVIFLIVSGCSSVKILNLSPALVKEDNSPFQSNSNFSQINKSEISDDVFNINN